MAKEAVSIIFPHQLYKQHPALDKSRPVYLVEESLYFLQYPFHQHKLVLHRAGMKYYQHYLEKKGYEVTYIDAHHQYAAVRDFVKWLHSKHIHELHYADTDDYLLERRLNRYCRQYDMKLTAYPNPGFINQPEEVAEYFDSRKRYFMQDFYIHQRKTRNILIDHKGPVGGHWSFDQDNRKKIPKGESIPDIRFPAAGNYLKEAISYVQQHFSDNPGEASSFRYPVTHQQAENWLEQFLEERFKKFGIYEDAIAQTESILYHSMLTPALNIGLLLPMQILEKALEMAPAYKVPINSLEGFVRQILGWREFMRILYRREGSRQRTTNFWDHETPMPDSMYKGTTGIPPIDQTIHKLHRHGYTHHIERLMILGNFMLLCELHPDAVYQWFMELYIDAYDWVMVPNVYGMSQFADGGLMSTKPYISSSNYVLKMSNYPKGDWCNIWDGLFWRFLHKHREFLGDNQRLGMLVKMLDKMDKSVIKSHLRHAEDFLGKLM
ncbi:cryptochrome/photolyase family protein [Chitinophaga rhizophila]|uniref:Cryptochrome/photolyase family protein n=1 Tax=Chitinophaga rhizophila TaxID=2866212 RepID=A0ABS7GMG1_9BACT|nr:cryptochrome/photolyase family protein [Chitinophaga rhizophila]MBW8688022.1 cryptochrome/photolyase family protein [Chitinophaga rhizophila]